MSDQATLQLIDRVVDGTASAAEEEELASRAARSESVRNDLNGTRRVFQALAAAAGVLPPPELKHEVMSRIRGAAVPAQTVSFASDRFRRRRRMILGWAAAAALAAIAIYPLLRVPPADRTAATGAMVRRQPAWTEVARAGSAAGDSAVLRRRGNLFEVSLEPAVAGSVELSWDAAALASPHDPGGTGRAAIACPAARCPVARFQSLAPERSPAAISVRMPGGDVLELRERLPSQ